MLKLKKPQCPVCGSDIEYRKIDIESRGSNYADAPSLFGNHKEFWYSCSNKTELCDMATHVYNQFSQKSDNDLLRLNSPIDDWRALLKRYVHFTEFAIDNNLRERLFAHFPDGTCWKAENKPDKFLDLFK
jgi:hypothetical protein